MKRLLRGLCLWAVSLLLSICVFAAPYTEHFTGPVSGAYFTVAGLQHCEDLGKKRNNDSLPDIDAYGLTPQEDRGSLLFRASGASGMRVGFYTTYGVFASYNQTDDLYRFSPLGGEPVFLDQQTSMLCLYRDRTPYPLSFNETSFAYEFKKYDGADFGTQSLIPYGVNLFASADGKTYVRLSGMITDALVCDRPDSNNNSLFSYYQIQAPVPDGYTYFKVELNRPIAVLYNNSPTPVRDMYDSATYLASIELDGASVRLVAGESPSSKPDSDEQNPPAKEDVETDGDFRRRSRADDTAREELASAQPQFDGTRDIDGTGRMVPNTPQPNTAQPSPGVSAGDALQEPGGEDGEFPTTNSVLSAEYASPTTPPSSNGADSEIKELVCLVIGAAGISALTYTLTAASRDGSPRKKRPLTDPIE